MEFVDTHCHIHFTDYGLDPDATLEEAHQAGVSKLICVGCTPEDSQAGVQFAQHKEGVWASVGIHPHEAKRYVTETETLNRLSELAGQPKVIAVGECGLDYYYQHSPKEEQEIVLRFQIEQIALKHNLPLIFHVRNAFEDFWRVIDEYEHNGQRLRGVIHSFTASRKVMEEAVRRGLYIGLNGIMTFTKRAEQLEMAKTVPLDKLILETDAPFLTPVPFRGKICKPSHVVATAKHLAEVRQMPLDELADKTTVNAIKLFNLGRL